MDKLITQSTEESQQVAKELAERILQQTPQKQAVVLALIGELGAGKTTFLQGFADGLGVEDVVNSPTFVIMKKFALSNSAFSFFYHFDCYRLENPDDVLHLGFEEIISDPKNIVAIEWPEKIEKLLPESVMKITFKHLEEHRREIVIQ